MTVAVLFARADSVYKTLPGVDVWDEARDARQWPGSGPAVAHPPCRAWGRLRAFANPAPHEKDLARFAVARIRESGGVLEHPAGSTLWSDQGLPRPGFRDEFDGWTLAAPQKWWGHKAEKASWFYIVGCEPADIPAIPLVLGDAAYVVQSRKRHVYLPPPAAPARPLVRRPSYACSDVAVMVPKENAIQHLGYMDLVRDLTCDRCGWPPRSQFCHADLGKGQGIKTDCRLGWPGCRRCHYFVGSTGNLGRDGRRQYELEAGARTRARIIAAGLWPARLPMWETA